MPDILLKDRDGNDIEYNGVAGLKVRLQDGTDQVFMADEGTGEDEGGGMTPYVFTLTQYDLYRGYYKSITYLTLNPSITLPAGATVLNAQLFTATSRSTNYSSASATGFVDVTKSNEKTFAPKITVTEEGVTVQPTADVRLSSQYYYAHIVSMTVAFCVPGIYAKANADGTLDVYADETATVWPDAAGVFSKALTRVDLSESKITTIPARAFYQVSAGAAVLPATLESIGNYGLYSIENSLDFSRCTMVPVIEAYSINSATVGQILVPAALYDEWIAAANWSTMAAKIVAV